MSNQFEFRRRLGAGMFGEVWLARDTRLNSICAVKCIPKADVVDRTNFFMEAQNLKNAEHRNVVKVFGADYFSDEIICISMEYLKKGSLEDEVRGAYLPITKARKIMIQVLKGLEHAHSKGILHRDVKPANILMADNGEAKLGDFGLSVPQSSLRPGDHLRGFLYRVHLDPVVKDHRDFTSLSDVYSCGVTLYRLVNGDVFLSKGRSLSTVELLELAKDGNFPDRGDYRFFVPRTLKTIINKAMHPDPNRRFQSAEEMRRKLESLQVVVNWNERRFVDKIRWKASHNSVCYQVELCKIRNGSWEVLVKKGRGLKNLKRVNSYCYTNVNKNKAEIYAKKALQDICVGKFK